MNKNEKKEPSEKYLSFKDKGEIKGDFLIAFLSFFLKMNILFNFFNENPNFLFNNRNILGKYILILMRYL